MIFNWNSFNPSKRQSNIEGISSYSSKSIQKGSLRIENLNGECYKFNLFKSIEYVFKGGTSGMVIAWKIQIFPPLIFHVQTTLFRGNIYNSPNMNCTQVWFLLLVQFLSRTRLGCKNCFCNIHFTFFSNSPRIHSLTPWPLSWSTCPNHLNMNIRWIISRSFLLAKITAIKIHCHSS